jgi:crooked neck
MEEMLGNVPGARQIFERWMSFEPDHHGWMAYIKARARPAARPPGRAAEPLHNSH